ncbi:hypothetical protein CCGE531_32215 (plasmid) [Rhizobium sp. CCGE531]|nr:hypothetical protein CCGE531_32215 [Rhizobium sp. CCGE531]
MRQPLIDRGELRLSTVDCSDTRWFEIDTEADLRMAEKLFADGCCNQRAPDHTELAGGMP